MGGNEGKAFRDPLIPGAPIIPRDQWPFPPFNRWTFQHVREMTPTARVWRGPGPVMPLPKRHRGDGGDHGEYHGGDLGLDLDAITFDHAGRRLSLSDLLADSFTSGFLVLSRGEVVAERYMNGLEPQDPHLAMSVSKSVVSTVFGIFVHRGVIDVAAPVTRYLPELEQTAYRGATVQQVLDMTSGVRFDETYSAAGSDIQKLDEVSGWKPLTDPAGPQTIWQFVQTLTRRDRPHGEAFDYRSIETDILGFVLERATGRALADLIARELWMPVGAEEDAYITVDRAGFALADGGFNATLRDFARFALLLLRDGTLNGRQIVPAAWIQDIRFGAHGRPLGPDYAALPHGAYRNQFWIEDARRGTYMCLGIHGQYIYLDPVSDFAVVKLSTWPEALNDDHFTALLAATHALRDFCAGHG